MQVVIDFFKNLPWYIMYPGKALTALAGGYVSQHPEIFPSWAVLLGAAVSLWVVVAFLWHAVSTWREHKGKPRLRLEPSHIIILGLAIALAGVVWQMRSPQSGKPSLPDSTSTRDPLSKNVAGPPIEWRFDSPIGILFTYRKPGDAMLIQAIQIHATNKTDKPLKNVRAIIVPDMMDRKLDMRVNPHGYLLKPEDSATLVPPRASFDLMVAIPAKGDGIPQGLQAHEFLSQYGGLKFEFAYDDGQNFGEYFSLKYLEAQIDQIEKQTREPLTATVPATKYGPVPAQSDEQSAGTATVPTAAPRRQPYRMTDNALPTDRQGIVRVSDGTSIPPDSQNADFQIYTAWLEAGNKPDPKEATLAPVYAARSPSDADKEIPVVDQLYNFIHDNSESLPKRGQELLQKWFIVMGDADQIASYKAELDKFAYEVMRVNNKILDMARQSGPYCANDLCLIVADATKINNELITSIGRFEIALDSISPVVDREKYTKTFLTIRKDTDVSEILAQSRFRDIVAPYMERPNHLLIAYTVWVSWAQRLLLERRDQLSIASRR